MVSQEDDWVSSMEAVFNQGKGIILKSPPKPTRVVRLLRISVKNDIGPGSALNKVKARSSSQPAPRRTPSKTRGSAGKRSASQSPGKLPKWQATTQRGSAKSPLSPQKKKGTVQSRRIVTKKTPVKQGSKAPGKQNRKAQVNKIKSTRVIQARVNRKKIISGKKAKSPGRASSHGRPAKSPGKLTQSKGKPSSRGRQVQSPGRPAKSPGKPVQFKGKQSTQGQAAKSPARPVKNRGKPSRGRAAKSLTRPAQTKGKPSSHGRAAKSPAKPTQTKGKPSSRGRATKSPSRPAQTKGKPSPLGRLNQSPGRSSRSQGRPAQSPGRLAQSPGRSSRSHGRSAQSPGRPGRSSSRSAQSPGRPGRSSSRSAQSPGKLAQSPGRPGRSSSRPAQSPGRPGRSSSRPAQSPGKLAQSPGRSSRSHGSSAQSPGRPSRSSSGPTQSPGKLALSPGRPGRSSNRPTQSPGRPSRSSSRPTQSPGKLAQSPGRPSRSSSRPTQSPGKLAQSPGRPGRSSSRSAQSPGRPGQSSSRSAQSPGRPAQSSSRSAQSPGRPVRSSGKPAAQPTQSKGKPTLRGRPAQSPGRTGRSPGRPGRSPGNPTSPMKAKRQANNSKTESPVKSSTLTASPSLLRRGRTAVTEQVMSRQKRKVQKDDISPAKKIKESKEKADSKPLRGASPAKTRGTIPSGFYRDLLQGKKSQATTEKVQLRQKSRRVKVVSSPAKSGRSTAENRSVKSPQTTKTKEANIVHKERITISPRSKAMTGKKCPRIQLVNFSLNDASSRKPQKSASPTQEQSIKDKPKNDASTIGNKRKLGTDQAAEIKKTKLETAKEAPPEVPEKMSEEFLAMKESLRMRAQSGGFLNMAKFSDAIHSKRKIYVPTIAELTKQEDKSRRSQDVRHKPVTCLDCGLIVPNRNVLMEHKKKCLNVGQTFVFACFECHKSFCTRIELHEHKRINHGESVAMDVTSNSIKAVVGSADSKSKQEVEICLCHLCHKVCMSKPELQKHWETEHKDNPFKRGKGSVKKTPEKKSSATTIHKIEEVTSKSHTGKKPVKVHFCQDCRLLFVTEEDLRKHCEKAHAPKQGDSISGNKMIEKEKLQKGTGKQVMDRSAVSTCQECNLQFKTQHSLDQHVAQKHLVRCDYCHEAFFGNQQLSDHMKTCFSKLTCDTCQLTLKTEDGLRKHKISHKNIKNVPVGNTGLYPCHECDCAFQKKTELKEHVVQNHRKELIRYLCLECGADFKTRDELARHKKSGHTEEKQKEEAARREISRKREETKKRTAATMPETVDKNKQGTTRERGNIFEKFSPNKGDKAVPLIQGKQALDLGPKQGVKQVLDLRNAQVRYMCMECNEIFMTRELLETHKENDKCKPKGKTSAQKPVQEPVQHITPKQSILKVKDDSKQKDANGEKEAIKQGSSPADMANPAFKKHAFVNNPGENKGTSFVVTEPPPSASALVKKVVTLKGSGNTKPVPAPQNTAAQAHQTFQVSKEELDTIIKGGNIKLKEFLLLKAQENKSQTPKDAAEQLAAEKQAKPVTIPADQPSTSTSPPVQVQRGRKPVGLLTQPAPVVAVPVSVAQKLVETGKIPQNLPAVAQQKPKVVVVPRTSNVAPPEKPVVIATTDNKRYQVKVDSNQDGSNIQIQLKKVQAETSHVQASTQDISNIISSLLPKDQPVGQQESIKSISGPTKKTEPQGIIHIVPEGQDMSEPEEEQRGHRPAILRKSNRKRPASVSKDSPPAKDRGNILDRREGLLRKSSRQIQAESSPPARATRSAPKILRTPTKSPVSKNTTIKKSPTKSPVPRNTTTTRATAAKSPVAKNTTSKTTAAKSPVAKNTTSKATPTKSPVPRNISAKTTPTKSPRRGSPRPSTPVRKTPPGSPAAAADSPLKFRCGKCMTTFLSHVEWSSHSCKTLPALPERRSVRTPKKTWKVQEAGESWKVKKVDPEPEQPVYMEDDHVEWLVAEMDEDE